MNRPKDPDLRQRLLDGAVRYVMQHGIGGLSLRPLAKEIGTTARMLMHHFGSKEALVAAILMNVEQEFARRAAADAADGRAVSATVSRMWKELSAPKSDPTVRALFEIWGHALVQPQLYPSVLKSMTEPWIEFLRPRFERSGHAPAQAVTLATLTVAAFQGLQLVRLSSGDQRGSQEALGVLMEWLDRPAANSRPKAKRQRANS